MTGPGPSVLHGVRRALGTAAARIYLAGWALLLGWALVVASEGSMAVVIPLFATLPASLVLLIVLPEGGMMFLLSIVLGALINAMVIGWCARALRRGDTPDTAS
ncbi:SCO4225 family membrane protein [Streptomyces sp. NPDC014676]|uniref:SCO4225 family membrane protein n=1 Tax=Streptomyces sp. NPDC014676 TaxID=3364879 RepID=UPI0036F68387